MLKASGNNLGSLMLGLIYPAVLGAAIVWILGYLTRHILTLPSDEVFVSLLTDIRIYFSILLLLYFCVPFLILVNEDFPNGYNMGVFLTDIGDVVVIFVAFFSLNIFDEKDPINYPLLYGALVAIPILTTIGNHLSGRVIHRELSIAMVVLTFVMAVYFHIFEIANILSIIALYFILACYFKKVIAKPGGLQTSLVASYTGEIIQIGDDIRITVEKMPNKQFTLIVKDSGDGTIILGIGKSVSIRNDIKITAKSINNQFMLVIETPEGVDIDRRE